MKKPKLIFSVSLFATLSAVGLLYEFDSQQAFAGVKVEQLQEMIDWNRDVNFDEAKKNLRLAKEINMEKRRRKQLRDAGVSEEEITKIIQNERLARANGGKLPMSQNNKTINHEKNNDNDEDNEDDENDNGDEDVWLTNKPSKKNKHTQPKDNDEITINGKKMPSGSNTEMLEKKEQDKREVKNNNTEEVKTDNNDTIAEKTTYDYVLQQKPLDSNKQKRDTIYNEIEGLSEQSYDDFELSRMVKKAGENANNPQHFAVFAKEVAKIANKQSITNNSDIEVEIPQINYNDDNELVGDFTANRKQYKQNQNKSRMYANNWVRYGGKNTKRSDQSKNVYQRLENMYAVATEDKYGDASNKGKQNKKMTKSRNNHIINANKKIKHKELYSLSSNKSSNATNGDDLNNEEMNEATNSNTEIVLGKNYITEKQAKAKQNGAPHPYRRERTDKRTQYLPQNISQIAYDDNNKHLKPAVFESHVINQVFDNLGDPNAVQIARALINKVGETDIKDEDGNTLLMHAVARKNQSLIAMLLAEGASPNAMNKEGFAPIHLASSNGDDTAIHSLMMSGANPNLKDRDGNTALMYASKMGNANSVKLMMSLGGDPTITNFSTGKTAFDFANENENPIIATLLETRMKNILRKRHPVELTR